MAQLYTSKLNAGIVRCRVHDHHWLVPAVLVVRALMQASATENNPQRIADKSLSAWRTARGMAVPPSHWAVSCRSVRFLLSELQLNVSPGITNSRSWMAAGKSTKACLHHKLLLQNLSASAKHTSEFRQETHSPGLGWALRPCPSTTGGLCPCLAGCSPARQ